MHEQGQRHAQHMKMANKEPGVILPVLFYSSCAWLWIAVSIFFNSMPMYRWAVAELLKG